MAQEQVATRMAGQKGALHRQLGVPVGEKIPSSKLAAAVRGADGPLAQSRAKRAKVMMGFNHGPKG